jgi:hypothetical protein
MRINLPTVLPVDPRAIYRSFPNVNISGPHHLVACINASNINFDIYAKNSVDSSFNGRQLVRGDLTSDLIISGSTEQVVAILNSYGGMRLVGARGPLGGLYLNFTLTAMTAPSLNPIHCAQGSAENTRSIYLRPLGLGQNLKKNGLTLKG